MTAKLSKEVLQRRVFNPYYYDLHVKEFLIGKTRQYINPKGVVLDVGAGVGQYTRWFTKHADHVKGYEAVPEVFEQLCKVQDDYLNFTPFNLAVSDKPGKEKFYVDDKRLSNSSFQNLVDGYPIDIEVVKLDEHCRSADNICFIKIDTEGTELDVLNGAQNIIDKHKPHMMIEVYDKFNKYPVDTTFKFCFDRGYSCFYNHRGQGLKPINDIEHGVKVAITMPEITDGDFLFLNGSRT